jgi:hypothetical protein
MELATGLKIGSTDRQKLGHSSLKQFGGLTVTPIKTCKQNPYAPARQKHLHWKRQQTLTILDKQKSDKIYNTPTLWQVFEQKPYSPSKLATALRVGHTYDFILNYNF